MFLSKLTWQACKLFAARPIGELERFSRLDPAAQRLDLAQRLLQQVHYFGSRDDALPEWREAARIQDPRELWRIWGALPIVTKATLNSRFEPLEMQRRFRLRGRINATGGSTGEPTRFFLDVPMLRASRGVHLYSRLKMGWRPGMHTVIIWGADRDIGKQARLRQRLSRPFVGDHMVPGFAIDDSSVKQVLAFIRKTAPVAIYGFSSLLEVVAQRVLALGEQVPGGSVKVAWNGGEMLYDRQIEKFRRAFGVPILNRYGGRELSVTAYQDAEGEPLRVLRPWVFLEIVDEAGKPAAPGQPGRLLLTSTICRGTPFLRYDVGDIGSYTENDRDESGIRGIRELHGRHAGVLRLKDGRIVSGLYWNHVMKDFPEVSQFQVRVKSTGSITVHLVGSGFTAARSDQFSAALRPLLRDQPVETVWIDSIPRTPQGKLLHVVQEP